MDQAALAKAAAVSRNVIIDFEKGRQTPRRNNLAAITRALEAAGVEFTNGDAPGVKLRKAWRAAAVAPLARLAHGSAFALRATADMSRRVAARRSSPWGRRRRLLTLAWPARHWSSWRGSDGPAIESWPPINGWPSFTDRALFFGGPQVVAAPPILAGTPTGTRSLVIFAHVRFSGWRHTLSEFDEWGVKRRWNAHAGHSAGERPQG